MAIAIDGKAAQLGQNIPNPASNSTIITYTLPADCKNASLAIIQTGSGKLLKTIPLNCGSTQLTLATGSLPAGSYMYSLYVDGRLEGSRQMVLAF